jgi:hypothetical protein
LLFPLGPIGFIKKYNCFLDVVAEYDVTMTIFCPGKIERRKDEIALHPNLETTYKEEKYQGHTSFEAAVKLKETYQQAIG